MPHARLRQRSRVRGVTKRYIKNKMNAL
ncbi:hypothetical protein Goarm_010136 [Gossypium armourianum]|uniref:Uncharacterized protein n=1 Tax=Gossypium armourianum TaxID=34283 RepID=A0A7J9JV57_9ROSI|nr:hypothetical protein [Gossypium armourianum]